MKSSDTQIQIRAWWLIIIALLLVFLPVLLKLSAIPFYQEAQYSDILISHLPNAQFAHNAVMEWRQIPLWSPMLFAGLPFAADPLSGMAYLPNWLAVLIPEPATFNLLMLLHLAWAALGSYVFARRSGFLAEAGVILGIGFACTPKILAHLGLGHFGLISAVSWTPWLLIHVESVVHSIHADVRSPAIKAGAILGVIFLADPRWSIPSLILALLLGLYLWVRLHQPRRGSPLQVGKVLLLSAGAAIGVGALLAFPLMELLPLSTRAGLSEAARDSLALDWAHLLGYIHPILGQPEQVTYLGVSLLTLVVVGFLSRRRDSLFWGGVFILTILLSMGSATPLYPLLTRILPGAGFLRVPARMLFLSAFAAAILASIGVEWVSDPAIDKTNSKPFRMTMLGWILLVVLTNIALATTRVVALSDAIITSVIVILTAAILELWRRGQVRTIHALSVLALVVVFDLGRVSWAMIRMEPADAGQAAARQLADMLGGSYGEARVFSPSYALPQNVAVDASIEMLDGVNPLQLASYADYLEDATGFESTRYTVTLPPFPNGDPKQPWKIDFDLELLARLNTSHIISDYPLQQQGLIPINTPTELYLYELEGPRPRAWVEAQAGGEWSEAQILEWTPNRIQLTVAGPGRLVLSEINYPGWQASLNDNQISLSTAYGLLRAVDIPTGEHRVVFSYEPRSVSLGAVLFGLTLVIALIVGRKQ